MPNRSRKQTSRPKRTPARQPERDENQIAFDALQQIIQQSEGTGKNPLAVALGRLGGLKGGRARADKMSPRQRSESAQRAARSRWGSKKEVRDGFEPT